MYTNIGLRNHQSVMNQGHKLVQNWSEKGKLGDYRDDALRAMAQQYDDRLRELDLLFKVANLMVNR